MPFINGLALPSMPLAKKALNETTTVEPPVQQQQAGLWDKITPPASDPRIQYIAYDKEPGDIPPPSQRIEYLPRPVYGPSISLFEAQFGKTAQDAMARMITRRQENLARMQEAQQTQLTAALASQIELDRNRKKAQKKLPGVRMICLRCKRNKPVNQKNDGITCTECIRKKKREESLALISSPPEAQKQANEMPVAQQKAMAMECDMGNPYPQSLDSGRMEPIDQDGEGMDAEEMDFFF